MPRIRLIFKTPNPTPVTYPEPIVIKPAIRKVFIKTKLTIPAHYRNTVSDEITKNSLVNMKNGVRL
jgi:hypothetical protein